MTYGEFLSWCQFRAQYGSLNLGMRVDRAVARGLVVAVKMMTKKSSVTETDFSPFDAAAEKRRKKANPANIEDAFGLLAVLAKKGSD